MYVYRYLYVFIYIYIYRKSNTCICHASTLLITQGTCGRALLGASWQWEESRVQASKAGEYESEGDREKYQRTRTWCPRLSRQVNRIGSFLLCPNHSSHPFQPPYLRWAKLNKWCRLNGVDTIGKGHTINEEGAVCKRTGCARNWFMRRASHINITMGVHMGPHTKYLQRTS